MKYLKLFETDSERVEYEGGGEYIEPYVSYVEENNSVHYNKVTVETRLITTYNVEDTSEPTKLYSYFAEEGEEEWWIRGVDLFDKIEIDDAEVSVSSIDSAEGYYELTSGVHTIKYTLKDTTTISDSLFYECMNITDVIIPNSVTFISNGAFGGCESLTSITIPNSVTFIDEQAFGWCTNLVSVTIPNSVTAIAGNAFEGCGSLTSIVVESGNLVYDSRNNCNAIIETQTNTLVVGCKATVIPNNVTSIGFIAFARCYALTSITIPSSVTTIGVAAFSECSGLTSIIIPDSVTSIGGHAFSSCYNVSSITIGNSVTSIGQEAFYYCVSLTSVTIPDSVTFISKGAFGGCGSLTSIIIGNNVTSIEEYTFGGCRGLTSVTIPNSVTSIGERAFIACSGLTSITIGNGVATIGINAFNGCGSLNSITSLAATAPTITNNTFSYVGNNGTLYVPQGSSGYDTWMGTGNYYLGYYNWTKVEQ